MEINGVFIDSMVVGTVSTNCYVVRREGGDSCVVIDPGEEGAGLADFVHRNGLRLEDILLTHGHFDHILGVAELRSKAGGRVCALEEERELLGDASMNLTAMTGVQRGIQADVYLRDGQTYETAGLTFTVIHTPGHTGGSGCYYLEKEGILFSGDTLFMESVGRTDFPTGNGGALMTSLREKVLTLPPEVRVFPGHGPATSIGYERENNPYA